MTNQPKPGITLQKGHDLPKQSRRDGEIPIISSSGITGYHNESKAEGPGVVTGRCGTLGEVFFVDGEYWPLNTTLFVTNFKGNDPLFVSYFLKTLDLARFNGAGAVPGLNRNQLHKISIRFPPDVNRQKQIAIFLKRFNDLIENNQRQISLLNEAVQQLYREWFVRFHFPGHETTKMIKGIPAGWETMQVSDWLESHIGGGWGEDFLVEDHNEAGFVIRGTDLPQVALGQVDRVPFRFHKSSNLKSRTLSDGDLVFEVSGGSKGQPVGRSLLISSDILESFDSPVICASFCKKIRPAKREYAEYMNLHLQYIREVGYMDVFATQSASNITNFKFTAFLTQHSFLLPSQAVLQNFNAIVGPIYKQIRTLGRQNLRLAEARDLLLPRLMSGEIEV